MGYRLLLQYCRQLFKKATWLWNVKNSLVISFDKNNEKTTSSCKILSQTQHSQKDDLTSIYWQISTTAMKDAFKNHFLQLQGETVLLANNNILDTGFNSSPWTLKHIPQLFWNQDVNSPLQERDKSLTYSPNTEFRNYLSLYHNFTPTHSLPG